MSAGRFQLVCRANDERMPFEQLARAGFDFKIARATIVRDFLLPFPRGNPAPEVGHLSVEELGQFCDAEIGRAIEAWKARGFVDRNAPIDQAGSDEVTAGGSDA